MSNGWRIRAALLVLAGTLGVHEARFALVPRHHEHELAEVHRYLTWLIPLIGVLLFLTVVHLAVRLRRPGPGAVPRLPGAPALWLVATTSLLTVFGLQETIETLLTTGAPPGVELLTHDGGWVVLPLAVAAGGALALLLRGAAAVAEWVITRSAGVRRRRLVDPLAGSSPSPILQPRGPVIARFLAGRAPPLLSR